MKERKIQMNWADYVSSNGLCSGCGLCESFCGNDKISVEINKDGFYRPKLINHLTQEEVTNLNVLCPGGHIVHDSFGLKNNYHPIWGPVMESHFGSAADPETRFLGSSGGGISALAVFLLESHKVDYILHSGASLLNPLSIVDKVSRTKEEVLSAAGSRYLPSAPLKRIEYYLSQEKTFAFIGKPCDIAALNNLSKIDPRVDEKILLKISFMCAGVPSINGSIELIRQAGFSEEKIKSIKYRGQGWPGDWIVIGENGKKKSMNYETSWGFLSHFVQFRCKICPDGAGEFADITFGDGWYLENNMPVFADRDGRNLMITRTGRGKHLLQDCCVAGYLSIAPLDINKLNDMQPYQAMRKKLVKSRLLALKFMGKKTPIYENLGLKEAARQAGLWANLRSFIGTLIRVCFHTSYETP